METKVFSVKGEEIKDIELSEKVFNCKVSEGSIYYAVNNELANRRVGTACTKTRSEIAGSSAKPWKQKGTGRARAGDRKSPIWVGGGIAFGPRPRDYSYKLPRKIKRLAMKSLLSMKVNENALKVVEDFTVESGKTRALEEILSNLVDKERTVVILKNDDPMMKRAGRNIPWVHMLSYNKLSAHQLFYGKNILILESAVTNLNSFFKDKTDDNNKRE